MHDQLNRMIFGPINSRRLGVSLGVDILPTIKSCSFNCNYCEIGLTHPQGYVSIRERMKFGKDKLIFLLLRLQQMIIEWKLDSITIGYNGEPTLVENLGDILDKIQEQKKRLQHTIPISIFTNSSTILDQEVCKNLSKVDKVIAKLDCALQDTFLQVDCPHSSVPDITDIIKGLEDYKKNYPSNELIIQTMLIGGSVNNITPLDIDALAKAYIKINPDLIHLYTVARRPAVLSVKPVTLEDLKRIKNEIVERTNPKMGEIIKVFP